MIDSRREREHIFREFVRYHNQVGENVVWYQFDTANSQYNSVYDEGGRRYLSGVNVAVLWIDQGEAPEQVLPEGRRGVQTIRFAVSARILAESGIGVLEAHGHRIFDPGLIKGTWFDDRVNDRIYYDGRYYEVSNFQIRGRIRDDVIIGVSGTEVWTEDEQAFDFPPPDVYTAPVVTREVTP